MAIRRSRENVGQRQSRDVIESGDGNAHVAQLAEHVLGKDEVTGSNPVMGSRPSVGSGNDLVQAGQPRVVGLKIQ